MTSIINQFPVIDLNESFNGGIHSTVTDYDKLYVDYSGQLYNDGGENLPFSEYKKLPQMAGKKLTVITWLEFDALESGFNDSLKTAPVPISAMRFNDMLEVLPPSRWHNAGGFEVFHVCERLTANLVSWFARSGDCYYEFTQDASISDADLCALLMKKA